MEENGMSRRNFIKQSAAGAAILTSTMSALKPGRVLGANDRVRVAIIGPGDRGRSLMNQFQRHAEDLNMELVAVCDIWKPHRDRAANMLKEWGISEPIVCRNTDELYERNDIDAVITATADFQHAWMAKMAVENGKDVFAEKPFAHFMEDAREAREVIKNSDRVFSVGTQRRSDVKYKVAADFVASGEFGNLVMVEMTWNVNQPHRWRRYDAVQHMREEDTDWRRFRLHLEKRGYPHEPFDPRKHLEFRLFWPYSSGLIDQWMSHQIDIVPWISGDPYPKSCVASGGIYAWKDGRANPDTFSAVFEYPSGFHVNYTSRQNNSAGGTREVFYSTKGALWPGAARVTGEGGDGSLQDQTLEHGPGVDHMRNWMECIRTRETPNGDIEAAYQHSVAGCMAAEALQTGKRVTFNPETHEIETA